MTQNYFFGFVPKFIIESKNKLWTYIIVESWMSISYIRALLNWIRHPKPMYKINNLKKNKSIKWVHFLQ